jgi:membrane associated rhomboid family serine protease
LQTQEPIFNVPGAVAGLIVMMIGVHVGRQFLSPDFDNWFVGLTAFIPLRYAGGAADLPGGNVASVTSFITHMFVHGDAVHLAFNCAWLLAFGGAIAKRIGGIRFLAFAALTGIAGALLFLALNFGLFAPVVGASGAISGLMGATMRFLFSALDDGGIAQLRDEPRSVRLMPLSETLTDRRVLLATAIWLLLNVLAVYGIGTGGAAGAIAWEAHIGGYLAGILTFGWFDLANAKENQSQPTYH